MEKWLDISDDFLGASHLGMRMQSEMVKFFPSKDDLIAASYRGMEFWRELAQVKVKAGQDNGVPHICV